MGDMVCTPVNIIDISTVEDTEYFTLNITVEDLNIIIPLSASSSATVNITDAGILQ